MMTKEQYKQFKAYATQYGTFVGAVWIGSFAAYVIGLSTPNIMFISPLLWLASFMLAIRLGKRFCLNANYEVFSFQRALWFMLLLFFYASLLTACVHFIYFRFIDNGYVVSAFSSTLQDPIYAEQLKQMITTEELTLLSEALTTITPTQMTFNLLTVNLFVSSVLAFPSAFAIMKRASTYSSNREDIR